MDNNKKERLIISCLVLNSSSSGYKTIIKNLLVNSLQNKTLNYKNIFVFQKNGWDSLEINMQMYISKNSTKIIIINSFKSKWVRAFVEQILINLLAIFYRCNYIFMPCTFGLIFPLKKTITFVHTNTSFRLPRYLRGRNFLQQIAHNLMIKITARTSYKLLFTSKVTKDEYINYTRMKDYSKIFLLRNGINISRFISGNLSQVNALKNKKFFLSVSQIYRLKNFDTLIRSYLRLIKNNSELSNINLVIVGTVQEEDYFDELLHLAQENKNIIFLHDVSDEELNWLYRNCEIYVFLSLFEGFSLTPAEALCSGKNVILSDIEVHREIYKNLVNFVDPYSVDSICNAILNRENISIPLDLKKQFISELSIDRFIDRLYSIIFN